jgi:membrane-associated phospholipid phosphatase
LQTIKKYRHGFWLAGFGLIYMLLFYYLEHRPIDEYHIIHTFLDDRIPFCEYFIVPYLLWFPYMFFAILYFIFRNNDKQEYYRLTKNLCMGMSLFLVISFLYPNGHHLRPIYFERDNIFVDLVKHLYQADTATNILPSIHVFNSLAIHMAVYNCKSLEKYRWVRIGSLFLTISIVLSTMFLKQHSVIDVCMGTGLALIGYVLFYREPAASRQSAAYVHRLR